MQHRFLIVLALWASIVFSLNAQNIPPAWSVYTTSGYISDIQSDYNTKGLSETDFKEYLLNVARTSLAKQIEVGIKDVAVLEKVSINGRTNITYNSVTQFDTDVTLKLVETRTIYDDSTKEGYAIAYIDKSAAIRYWSNELNIILSSAESSLNVAHAYISTGFKDKAKEELRKAEKVLSSSEQPLFWIAFLGVSEFELEMLLNRRNSVDQSVKSSLSELQYGTTICIKCTADNFGQPYVKLANDIKGNLSLIGCNFVSDEFSADWVVIINATSREYNKVDYGSTSAFFSYVDAVVSIEKTATSQVVCEDEISVKGSHTRNYVEAARDAYKEIGVQITDLLSNYIK